jgi:four helix bundle protein
MGFADDIQQRLQDLALRVIEFCRTLPKTDEGRHLGDQLRRATTAASATYRASRRGRSRAEWLAKLAIVVEELDESDHWFTLIDASKLAHPPQDLIAECRSLRAILAKSRATALRRTRKKR